MTTDVIITTYNESDNIVALLKHLKRQKTLAQQIIIVDNCSQDKTAQLILEFAQRNPQLKIKLISQKTTRSQARNLAIQKSQADLIAITDAGCLPHSDWLTNLVNCYQQQSKNLKDKNLVIAGFYQGLAKTAFEQAVIPYALVMPDRLNLTTFLPATRSMLLPKKVWQTLGGFNEKLNFSEDYEFAQRLVKQQIKIVVEPTAIVDWLPRKNFLQFLNMIFNFAKGDMLAKTYRPKVALIFLRYLLGIALFFYQPYLGLTVILLYLMWAIKKNYRYAKQAWFYLPLLQIGADWAVMSGTITGGVESWLK